ncbi:uncharacterized protein zgc:113176 [Oncorhynchus nerka]|uniref:uncharacterized protein zgc:113176 n=1 Tax=Oncorhynchus nerka TaxID=8023 RepID=UPI0031B85F39
MTRRRLPLLAEASTRTGLSESMVKNWLGNERVKLAQSKAVSQHKTKLYKCNVSAYNLFMRDHLKAKDEADGQGRVPCMTVAAKQVVIEIEGMPAGIKLKKPSHYGMDQLSSILEAGRGIKFAITRGGAGPRAGDGSGAGP